jgi:hypothetical protein
LLNDSLGHFVRGHGRPVWGNSKVGDFDVGFAASTLNRRIVTFDQLPSVEVAPRSQTADFPDFDIAVIGRCRQGLFAGFRMWRGTRRSSQTAYWLLSSTPSEAVGDLLIPLSFTNSNICLVYAVLHYMRARKRSLLFLPEQGLDV